MPKIGPLEALNKYCHTSSRLFNCVLYRIEDIRAPRNIDFRTIRRTLEQGQFKYEWLPRGCHICHKKILEDEQICNSCADNYQHEPECTPSNPYGWQPA